MRKNNYEVDVAVFGELPDGREVLLSPGEAKWNDVMGRGHLDRLRRIRDLLASKFDTAHTLLTCFSGAGFMPDLTSGTDDVLLVSLDDPYATDGRAI